QGCFEVAPRERRAEAMSLTLRAVLDAHARCRHSTSLGRVLGDGYLYTKNHVFRAVRDAVIERGFSFTPDDFCDYRGFRLGALPAILEHRAIPFLDTHGAFERLERQLPGSFLVARIPIATGNYLLHEGSHCVADGILPATDGYQIASGRRVAIV